MGILTCGDQGQVTEGAPRAALRDLRSCSVAIPIAIVRVSACTLSMFCCSVRPCTDLCNWMAGRGAGAGPLPSDRPIRGCVQAQEAATA